MEQPITGVRFIILVWLVSWFWGLAQPVWAQDNFDYNYILSDEDMFDYQSMDLSDIADFLQSHNSPLASYVDPVTLLRADQIINLSAQQWQVNPKYLLALIQKEQSLIDNSAPTAKNFDWATGYAVCDGCSTDDPLLQKFKGFYNQVYDSAKRLRLSYWPDLQVNGKTISGFGPGITKLVDGWPVTPVNNATAIAYTYTPHLSGNRLLWTIWNRYFARSYPDGTLVSVNGSNDIYLLQDGSRRRFVNPSVYLSYYNGYDRVVIIQPEELLKYPEASPINFANYSFLRIPTGTVYLLVDNKLRGFASREALRQMGINPSEIIDVKPEDLTSYGTGEPITVKSVYPLGVLLQDKSSGGVYWVQDNIKHPIWSAEILKANFRNRKLTKVSTKQLEVYPTGQPVTFRDGELIKSKTEPTVYLISKGQRRPFQNEKAFIELGFNFNQIISTSAAAVNLHDLGDPLGQTF